MATRILDLPLIAVTLDLSASEDWLDAWSYEDDAGEPIPLDGLDLTAIMRPSVESEQRVLVLGTPGATLPPASARGGLVVGGVGRNVLALDVRRPTTLAIDVGTYGADILAVADGVSRRIAILTATVSKGYTR